MTPEERTRREHDIEREQVEQVFGLTGGELADERWDCVSEGRYSDGEGTGDFYTFGRRYWYEGVPEYVDSEFRGNDEHDGVYRTTLTFGGGYLEAPESELWDGQGRWVLRASYNSSGECECPARRWDPITRLDGPSDRMRVVTQAEADSSVDGDCCPLCEEKVGAEHAYIYIGEGYEAVYELESWPLPIYEVIVGNIGRVFTGTSKQAARTSFDEYVFASKQELGRGAGEYVTLMCDGEIEQEHEGRLSNDGQEEEERS